MIGVDTNILVRFFTRDDDRQSRLAQTLIDSLTETEQGFVSLLVLLELDWVLHYVFKLSKPEIIEIFAKLTTSSAFKLENLAVLVHSIRLYATTSADFADCLIAGVATQAGCAYTLTLDRKACRVPGMRRLK